MSEYFDAPTPVMVVLFGAILLIVGGELLKDSPIAKQRVIRNEYIDSCIKHNPTYTKDACVLFANDSVTNHKEAVINRGYCGNSNDHWGDSSIIKCESKTKRMYWVDCNAHRVYLNRACEFSDLVKIDTLQ